MALHLRPIMKNLKKHVFEKSCYFGGKIAKKWRKNRHFWWAKYPTGPVGYWVGFRAGSGITNTRNTRSGTRLSGTWPITSRGKVLYFAAKYLPLGIAAAWILNSVVHIVIIIASCLAITFISPYRWWACDEHRQTFHAEKRNQAVKPFTGVKTKRYSIYRYKQVQIKHGSITQPFKPFSDVDSKNSWTLSGL